MHSLGTGVSGASAELGASSAGGEVFTSLQGSLLSRSSLCRRGRDIGELESDSVYSGLGRRLSQSGHQIHISNHLQRT